MQFYLKKRHKNDKLANEQLTKVLDTKSKEEDPFKVVKWKDIRVGDIIKVSEGEVYLAYIWGDSLNIETSHFQLIYWS